MAFTFHESCIRSIKPGDDNFYIRDGITITPRAGLEISKSCPSEYISILKQALNAGWVKPVANVTDYELLVMTLERK
jgi:hypothetical protein